MVRGRRRVVVVVGVVAVAAVVASLTPGIPGSAGAATTPWRPPVAGPVVRGFDAGAARFGAGHRGVDFAAPAGTEVRAAGPGVVVFAGEVAGATHVVVDHGSEVRTTVSFLASVAVRVGDHVDAGRVLGTSGGGDDDTGHGSDVVHFGVRVGERYVDPAVLLTPGDPADRVHLAPVDPTGPDPGPWVVPGDTGEAGPPVPDDGCRVDVPLPGVGGLVGAVVAVACSAVVWSARETWTAVQVGLRVAAGWDVGGRAVVRRFTPVLRRLVRHVAALAASQRAWFFTQPAGLLLRDLYAIGVRVSTALRAECGDDAGPSRRSAAGPVDGSGPTAPHRLMAVAGIDSSTGRDGHTFGLDLAAIGVRERDVTWYSYAPDGGDYTREATENDLRVAARGFAEQLRALFAADPDRPVDVVAHSQGGVVVDWFLTHQYDRHPERYPPLTTVVTLASPHRGAPLAATVGALRAAPRTAAALGAVDRAGIVPRSDSVAVRQLAEGSDFMRALWANPLPSHLSFVSVGGTDDVVVPADRIHVDGATEIVVAVDGPVDHSAIVADERAMDVVRRALAGRPLPCVTVEERVRSAVEPVLISGFEERIGPALAAFSVVGP